MVTPSRSREEPQSRRELAEMVRSILATKGLTLYRVSQRSENLYGRSSAYFLPHNLYYDLHHGSFTPSIHQFCALSHISGYRLRDWLRLFGLDLENIARTQVLLPTKRTLLLDDSHMDADDLVRWFRNRRGNLSVTAIVPLRQLLEPTGAVQAGSLPTFGRRGFLYAKIGREDAYAYPDLGPGSIVRVVPRAQSDPLLEKDRSMSNRLFLIEHSRGFSCCRIEFGGNDTLVLTANLLSYRQVELRVPSEARILGTVDLEFRPLFRTEEPEVPKDLGRNWKPDPLERHANLGEQIQRSRMRLNLSFREAAAKSRAMAGILNDSRYAISPSSLCDYELRNAPPRELHKVVTLCALYALPFQFLLDSIGVSPESATGGEAIPRRYLEIGIRSGPSGQSRGDARGHEGFLERLIADCDEVPFCLRNSLEWFSHSKNISLDDFFWIGEDGDPLHPFLANAIVAMVNRRRKRAIHFVSKPWWQQPLYLIVRRDGSYLAGCCAIEDNLLTVYPYTSAFHRPLRFRHRYEAEVVGQILGVARKLG